MEWNLKTPSDWDLENLAIFSGKAIEVPKKVQLPIPESGGDAGVDSGSIYSSGGTGLSGFTLGHGYSSKSSISASADSSSKEGIKTFGTVHDLPKEFNEKEELARVSHNGSSPTLGASIESDEPMGKKFGKRACLDDTCAANTARTTSFSVATSSSTTKRSRVTYQSSKTPRCQVEGCNLELKSAKDYHRRHRICESHSKSPKVIVAGMVRRFCQQCSRFHDLSEFDDKKRSCRKRLYDHNARRRRPLPDTIQSTSLRLSSSLYDGRRQMDLLLNKVPTEVSNPTSQSACSFKVTHARDSLIRTARSGVINRQLDLSSDEMPFPLSMLHLDSDNALSLQETTRRVLNHGLEASAIASNLNVAPDVRRALSLLSTTNWGLNEPGPTSLEKLMHANQIGVAQPVMHAESQNGAIASSEYVQVEQTPSQSRVHSLDFHNNGSSQFQEFQLFKAPYESSYFYSSRIN